MSSVLDDAMISNLIGEPKPAVHIARLVPRQRKRGHLETQMSFSGGHGSTFRLVTRQLVRDPNDFSVILGYEVPGSSRLFRLRRHNGLSHRHTNKLEGVGFFDWHVHLATERYQLAGFDEEGFAEPTDQYVDLQGALQHMLDIAAFAPPAQGTLL